MTADDGVRHELWVVDDEAAVADLTRVVDALPALYIADGHHRSAAALRVAEARGVEDGYFLAVLLPEHEMTILDYNRVLRDLNGLTTDEVLREIGRRYVVEPSDGPVRPGRADEVGMVLEGRWHRLTLKPEILEKVLLSGDPVARLPVTLLAKNVIEPIFGVTDPRRDKRIDFVGGGRGLEELERLVKSRAAAIAFALYPTQMSRPHGGRRRRRDHAAEVDMVRAQARRRHGEPHAGLRGRFSGGSDASEMISRQRVTAKMVRRSFRNDTTSNPVTKACASSMW